MSDNNEWPGDLRDELRTAWRNRPAGISCMEFARQFAADHPTSGLTPGAVNRKRQRTPGLKTLRRGQRVNPVNRARKEQLRVEQFGTPRRVEWFMRQRCVCRGEHPACTRGWSDPSHTTSRGAGGKAHQIIPQSRGCHDYIGAHGWDGWEATTGIDRHAEAVRYAKLGPDAPGVLP